MSEKEKSLWADDVSPQRTATARANASLEKVFMLLVRDALNLMYYATNFASSSAFPIALKKGEISWTEAS